MKKRMRRKKNFSARNVGGKCLNSLKIFKLKKNRKLTVVNLCSKHIWINFPCLVDLSVSMVNSEIVWKTSPWHE